MGHGGKKNDQVILGIDPGIADTGWGVISRDPRGRLACLAYGSIKTPAKTDLAERLSLLKRGLDKIIGRYRPGLAGIEQLFFCANVKTAITVGQARGVALLALYEHGLPLMEFTPLQVKQAVSTYGKASKLQVQKMVKLLLGLDCLPRPDDAADALAIAVCAANTYNTNIANNARMTRIK